jgi:hypothetical protein
MLTWLRRKSDDGLDGSQLLEWWHDCMEKREGENERKKFFSEVVKLATTVTYLCLTSCLKFTPYRQFRATGPHPTAGKSPHRMEDHSIEPDHDIEEEAKRIYNRHAKAQTEALVAFVTSCHPGAVLVTYFDEADELDTLFWVLLRLLSNQDECTPMWYIFMATKSSVSYFNPIAEKSEFYVLYFEYVLSPGQCFLCGSRVK